MRAASETRGEPVRPPSDASEHIVKLPFQSARERRHETPTRVSGWRFATGVARAAVLERDGAGSEVRAVRVVVWRARGDDALSGDPRTRPLVFHLREISPPFRGLFADNSILFSETRCALEVVVKRPRSTGWDPQKRANKNHGATTSSRVKTRPQNNLHLTLATAVRHLGHSRLMHSHRSMHARWNRCAHVGRRASGSPGAYSQRHTTHSESNARRFVRASDDAARDPPFRSSDVSQTRAS